MGLADSSEGLIKTIKENNMAPRLIKVSPSIIAIDYKNDECLTQALKDIEKAGITMIHLDVMDGKFVKNTTFDYKFIDKIKDMTSLLLEVHLMVENPENTIDNYAKAGADIITVHYEACKNLEETLKLIKSKNILAGVAVNPTTPALKLKEILKTGLVDIVTVMGVKPGACGQKFIPGSAEKVAEIRELDRKVYIEIDGGVTSKNAYLLRKMGVNIIVSGSTVFNSKNMKKTIKQLRGRGLINNVQEYFK